MRSKVKPAPFFIGYMNKIPKGLGLFLFLVIVGFVGSMSATSFFVSASIVDPGKGFPRWDIGRQELIGRLEYAPYPVLRVPPEGDQPARSYMLSGLSKVGVIKRGEDLDGVMVRVEGIMAERGDLSMMQVVQPERGLVDAEDYDPPAYYPPASRKLGKWRLTGEICDGKCYAGAMRPGRGLAHKACASLCLYDEVPPVFVSQGEVNGRNFFMLADKNGQILGREISEFLALYLTAEGEIDQIDDLMIFKIDLDSVVIH